MKGFNQLDPAMMNQAHMLGQQRAPTESEIAEARRHIDMTSLMQVAGAVLTSLLEGGFDESREDRTTIATGVAKKFLSKLDSLNDHADNPPKRKARNQMAAQLIYSILRSSGTAEHVGLVDIGFDMADEILKESEDYAEEMAAAFAATATLTDT